MISGLIALLLALACELNKRSLRRHGYKGVAYMGGQNRAYSQENECILDFQHRQVDRNVLKYDWVYLIGMNDF